MTTILASVEHGVIVADSNISDGDRLWFGKKVWRWGDQLIALSGDVNEGAEFLKWWKSGMQSHKPKFSHSSALILDASGLTFVDFTLVPARIKGGREAIGTGAKAAMCAFEALDWQDPKRAVQIVCRHDAGSRGPVRVYRLKG